MFYFPLVFNSHLHIALIFFLWVDQGRFCLSFGTFSDLQQLISMIIDMFSSLYFQTDMHITFISHEDTQGERLIEMSQ